MPSRANDIPGNGGIAGGADAGSGTRELFRRADKYDASINWAARLGRELPVLVDVLGPPGAGEVVDAGCGPGRHACAMAERGYRVVGADLSEFMVRLAGARAEQAGVSARFVVAPYARLHETLGGGFAGLYCLGNSLSAAGSRDAVAVALAQFAACLCEGGQFLIQILNYPPMRSERPCIRGPRVGGTGGREHISVRQFHFVGDLVEVTAMTLWQDGGWRLDAEVGVLYPLELHELRTMCRDAGLRINAEWGSYAREPFEPQQSSDLIVAGQRL